MELGSQIFNSRFPSSQIRWDSILAPFDMLYNAAAHISHSARQHKTVLENFLPVLVVVTVFSVCQLVPTCFEKTAISSLNDSELQTSPPATPGSRGVHVANSHFSKIRARRGNKGCLKQGRDYYQLSRYTTHNTAAATLAGCTLHPPAPGGSGGDVSSTDTLKYFFRM